MASNAKGHLDKINPGHYQKGNGVETIDYILAVCKDLDGDEAVCVGNIIRYVSRYKEKHPKAPEVDVQKAQWYCQKLLKILLEKSSKAQTMNNATYNSISHDDFVRGVSHQ